MKVFYCSECGAQHEIKQNENIDKDLEISQEKHNKLIQVVSEIYGYNEPHAPLTVMVNILLALCGYQFPEHEEIEENINEMA